MSDVGFMDKLLDGAEVEWKRLGDYAEIRRGTAITKKEALPGDFPVVGNGPGYNYFHAEGNRIGETIVIARSGAYAGLISFWTIPIFLTDAFSIHPGNEHLRTKFVYYLLKKDQEKIHQMGQGAGVPHVRANDFEAYPIPIPCPSNPKKSLEIQGEIVRILDTFTELTAELTARRKQYIYYRDQLLRFDNGDVEWKTLGEVAEIGTGSHDTQDAIDDGDYIFYARGREALRLDVFDFDETAIITAGDGAGVGKVFHYAQGKYALHQRAYRIVPRDNMVPRFVYHCMASHFYEYILKASVSSSVTSLRRPMFLNFPIPVPSFAEQARIACILDKFDSLTNSITEGLPREIELRRQQYEYYRDLLLSFPKPDEVTAFGQRPCST